MNTTTDAFTDGIFSVAEEFGAYEENYVFSTSPDMLTFRVIHIPTGFEMFTSKQFLIK